MLLSSTALTVQAAHTPLLVLTVSPALCRHAATALWGISAHLGTAQSLTQAGHLLGHVRDSAGALLV